MVVENFDFFVNNSQCKHIIFGGCDDSGYAVFLGRYAARPSIRDRITLLQNGAIHPNITSSGFKRTVRFDSLFAPSGASTSTIKDSHPTSSTSLVPTAPAVGQLTTTTQPLINPSPLLEKLGSPLYNENGQRIDKLLNINLDSPYLGFLHQNNLCQWYYLRGICQGCSRNHSFPPLKAKRFDYLWYVARGGLCYKLRKGGNCKEPLCIYGHEKGCQIGSG